MTLALKLIIGAVVALGVLAVLVVTCALNGDDK